MSALSGKTALVTGATGFLGGALARRLAADGVKVKALARRPNRDRYISGIDNIEIVSGDIMDAARMNEVTQGCDVVFHVAAGLGGTYQAQYQTNVEGTRHVILAAENAQVKRLVHVSTIAIYGIPDGTIPVITEDTEPRFCRTPYNLTKREGEKVLIAAAKNVEYSIVRPAMIYGANSALWTKTLFNIARRNPAPFVGNGSGNAHPIYVEDVADMMLVLATHPKAVGEIFHCAPDPAPTWREWLMGYSALVGHQNWLSLPAPLLIALGYPIEATLILRGQPFDTPQSIRYLTKRLVYSMQKAREKLNWQPKVSLAEGIQKCVPYLREKGWLSN
jgi:nucleoside-diphosphate-sugar epimerase